MNRKNVQFTVFYFVWFISVLSEANANPFSFGGDAAYFNAIGGQTKNFNFDGVIGDNFWKIKIYSEGHTNELGDVEYGFSATNQFYLEYVNTDPYQVVVKKNNSIFINGAVTPRSTPASLTSFIQVYWMAFNMCLEKTYPPLTLPGKMISGDLNTNQYSIHCNISPDNNLIASIHFINPGKYYGMSGVHPESPPYDKGYVAANFSVKKRTQFDQKLVPVIFEWRVFNPVEGGASSNDLKTVYLVKVHVTRLSEEVKQTSWVPVPPSGQKMVVNDYRLAEESKHPDALYVSTNGFAVPGGNLFGNRLEKLSVIKNEDVSNNRIGRYVLMVILRSTAAMLMLLLIRTEGKKSK